MTDLRHVTEEFQSWSKAQQVEHLRTAHGIEASAKTISGWTPVANTPYQLHVTAHSEEAGR